jgi:hypothetical protein
MTGSPTCGTIYDHAAMVRDGSTRPHHDPPSHGPSPSRYLAEAMGPGVVPASVTVPVGPQRQWELHVDQAGP